MSLAALAWAKSQRTGSPTLKAVLVAVADYADEAGAAWPSQVRLAEDTELSERAVRNALSDLEEKGLLTRESRRRQDGSRATDRLILAVAGALQQPAPRSEPPAPPAGTTGTSFQINRHVVPDLPAPPAGLTTFEPPENHQKNQKEDRPIAEPVVSAWPKDGHSRFYAAYPRKQGRAESEKAFAKLQRHGGATFDAVMAGVDRLVRSDPDPQFVPHPATWLNQRRWEDEPIPARTTGPPRLQAVRTPPPDPFLLRSGLLDDLPHRQEHQPAEHAYDQPRRRDPPVVEQGRGPGISELRDPGRLRSFGG